MNRTDKAACILLGKGNGFSPTVGKKKKKLHLFFKEAELGWVFFFAYLLKQPDNNWQIKTVGDNLGGSVSLQTAFKKLCFTHICVEGY